MEAINKKKVKIKNLMGIIDEPLYEDLLFEIVQFLDNSSRYDGEFKMREVSLYTRVRIEDNLEDDLRELVNLGYVENLKRNNFKVIKHIWA